MLTPAAIERFYGLPYGIFRADIKASLEQSRECAGLQGRSRRLWFDHFMSDIIAEWQADNAAARDDFERAYGRD